MILRRIIGLALGSLIALCVLASSSALLGQAVNATLLGTVQDASGATIAGAKVSATETSTGELYQSATNESGNYTFPDLLPGPYSVTVEAQGFKKEKRENIDLASNSSTRVDFSLVPGSVSETVLVSTAPPLLQTDRADISTKIEATDLVDMALGTNRNFQSLLNTVPGAAPGVFEHSQFFNAASSLQTEMNGLPLMGNLYQIEGIDDDQRTGLLQIIIPPAEAIASVDISTDNYEAELGRATGGVMNVTLKSGTNRIHGSAFEFIQNNDLNARSYFQGPLGHLSYNYFGGTIGGPIKKDKLFYFGDYLHTSDHEAIGSTFTIPDSRWFTPNSSGNIDLSAGYSASGAGQIYDPATGNGLASSPRKPFVNNQIPIGRVNPVSLTILQDVYTAAKQYTNGPLYAAQTVPLNNPTNNYLTNVPFTKTMDSFDPKVDWSPSEKNHLSGRFSFARIVTFQAAAFGPFLGGPEGSGFEGTGPQNAYSTGGNYTHIFSPTFFTEARVGVAHQRNESLVNDNGTSDATTLGIPGVNISGQPFTSGQAEITLSDFSGPLIGYSPSEPWIRAESNIDAVNIWTKIVGNHTFKAGVDLRRVRDDLLQDQTFGPRGAFTFSEPQTSNAGAIGTNVANDIASFLLDQPSGTGRDLNTFFPCYRQWWFFAFASDKWQATPKMTLDLGLRWEFYPPATPKVAGGFSNYDPANNTLVLAGLGGNPSNLGMKTQYGYFAPRLGISYRLTNDMVVRAGFGISYVPFPDNGYAYNYPIRANNAYNPTGSSPYTPAVLADGVTVASFQAGFPAPVAVSIPANGIINVSGNSLLNSSSFFYIPPTWKNPYADSWNVAVERSFRNNLSLQVAYVGNHGTHMASGQNINDPGTFDGGASSDPENATFGRTASTTEYYLGFSSNYDALQSQLTLRASHGLTFMSAYTWGKGLNYMGDPDSGVDFFINLHRNYGPDDQDRKSNFEQTMTYALPFGRGHALLNSAFGDAVLGGWKITGLVSVVSGLPLTMSASGSSLNTPGTEQTATLSTKWSTTHHVGASSPWFNTNSTVPGTWVQPSGCTGATPGSLSGGVYTPSTCTAPGLGNTGRGQFRGPGYLQDNASIFKKFTIYRESAVEIRVDAFQLSNTPQFGNPNTSGVTAASFGTVTGTLGSGQGSVNGVGGGRVVQGSAKFTF
jgi:hypothetical protein